MFLSGSIGWSKTNHKNHKDDLKTAQGVWDSLYWYIRILKKRHNSRTFRLGLTGSVPCKSTWHSDHLCQDSSRWLENCFLKVYIGTRPSDIVSYPCVYKCDIHMKRCKTKDISIWILTFEAKDTHTTQRKEFLSCPCENLHVGSFLQL